MRRIDKPRGAAGDEQRSGLAGEVGAAGQPQAHVLSGLDSDAVCFSSARVAVLAARGCHPDANVGPTGREPEAPNPLGAEITGFPVSTGTPLTNERPPRLIPAVDRMLGPGRSGSGSRDGQFRRQEVEGLVGGDGLARSHRANWASIRPAAALAA